MLVVGFALGWFDGAIEIDGFTEGIEDGRTDTLGSSDGANVGVLVLVGLTLGLLEG